MDDKKNFLKKIYFCFLGNYLYIEHRKNIFFICLTCLYFLFKITSYPTQEVIFLSLKNFWKIFPALPISIKKILKSKPVFKI